MRCPLFLSICNIRTQVVTCTAPPYCPSISVTIKRAPTPNFGSWSVSLPTICPFRVYNTLLNNMHLAPQRLNSHTYWLSPRERRYSTRALRANCESWARVETGFPSFEPSTLSVSSIGAFSTSSGLSLPCPLQRTLGNDQVALANQEWSAMQTTLAIILAQVSRTSPLSWWVLSRCCRIIILDINQTGHFCFEESSCGPTLPTGPSSKFLLSLFIFLSYPLR